MKNSNTVLVDEKGDLENKAEVTCSETAADSINTVNIIVRKFTEQFLVCYNIVFQVYLKLL